MQSGTFFGSLIGWYLAGPAGGLLGSFLGTWFHQSVPEVQDVLQELLGGLSADAVTKARDSIKTHFQYSLPETYKNKIQSAAQIALRESIVEISSNTCGLGPKRHAPDGVPFLVSALKQHHPSLATKACQIFATLYDQAQLWFIESSTLDPITLQQSYEALQDLNRLWLESKLDQSLEPYKDTLNELAALEPVPVFDLRAHTEKHLLSRMMWYFSDQLRRDPDLWRIYSFAFQQNLLASLNFQTSTLAKIEKQQGTIESQLRELTPNVFQIANVLEAFSSQFSQLSSDVTDYWERVVNHQRETQAKLAELQEEIQTKLEAVVFDLLETEQVIEWVGPADMEPVEPADRKLVLGQTISVRQIRENRFMARPELVNDLLQELDGLVEASRKQRELGYPKLFTLWINGRSGTGKSVLLLQLMQRLVLERQLPVLWLQDNSLALPAVIKRWMQYKIPHDQPVFIFLDDFYTVQASSNVDEELEFVARMLRSTRADKHNWPILVTCSPPENVQRFLQTGHEGFEVKPWQLQPIKSDQYDEVADWFEQFTNNVSQRGTAFADPEGLFVSMVVDLEFGELKEFAKRFKRRLEQANLLKPLAPFLALNRLYLYPPAQWLEADLTPAQWDAFDLLNSDSDFSLNPEGGTNNRVRLTHPHLSDAIYQSIRPDSERRQRSADLVDLFERALNEKPVLGSLLLQTIVDSVEAANSHEESDSVSLRIYKQCDLDYLITHLWRVWQNTNKSSIHPNILAWLWFHWTRAERISALLAQYTKLEKTNTFSETSQRLKANHGQWGLIWQGLWRFDPGHQVLFSLAQHWIQQSFTKDRPDWAHVWRELVAAPTLPPDTSREQLLARGLNWLDGRDDRSEWSFVWQTILSAPTLPPDTSREQLLARGLNWLDGRDDRSEWAHVWRALVADSTLPPNTSREQLLARGLNWLDGRDDRSEWAHVWRELVAAPTLPPDTSRERLLARGLNWLDGRDDRSEWSFVWQTILSAPTLPPDTSREQLLARGLNWLDGRDDRSEWSFVWQTILSAPTLPPDTSREQLLARGLNWLDGRIEHNDWYFVWRELVAAPTLPPDTSREHLLARGLNWLDGRDDRSEWSFVWQTILSAPTLPPDTSREQLLARGLSWLDGRDDRSDWSHVWRELVAAPTLPPDTSREQLLARGLNWLDGRDDRSEWNYVWQTILSAPTLPPDTSREQLLARGLNWLDGRDDRSEWFFVWQTILAAPILPPGTSREQILARGLIWLDGRDDRSEWFFVWQTILAAPILPPGTSREQILARGLIWLDGRDDRSEWAFVWRALVADSTLPPNTSRELLLARGLSWLDGRDDRSEWSHVWQTILSAPTLPPGTSREQLLARGLSWLDGRDDRSEWSHVWQTILSAPTLPPGTSREQLLARGLSWLDGRDDRSEWSHVWRELVAAPTLPPDTSREQLLARGLIWLDGRDDRSEWAFVWHEIYQRSETFIDEKLTFWRRGALWLYDNLHRGYDGWPYVYEDILEAPVRPTPTFYELGRQWILNNLSKPESYGVAEKILKQSARTFSWDSDDPVVSFLRDWLQSNFHNGSWGFVWEAIWAVDPSMQSLDLFLTWLDTPFPKPRAVYWLVRNKIAIRDEIEIHLTIQKWLDKTTETHPVRSAVSDGLQLVTQPSEGSH